MNKNNNIKPIPQIRFAGFTETWEQCKLKDIIEKGGSGGTPNTSISEYYNGEIPFLSIGDITDSNGYIYSTEKHITEVGLNNSSAWIVPEESISLAMYASVGKVAILKEKAATSQAFYNLVFNDNTVRDLVFQILKKMEENSEWEKSISTGTQRNLNSEKVKEQIVTIPKEHKEQEKIGQLLKLVDKLIILHQCKCDKLENIKDGLLARMFPENENSVPKLRFDGFTEAWEQCELKKIGRIETGNTPSTLNKEYYSEHGMLWVTPTDIIGNVIFETEKYLSLKGEKVGRVVPKDSTLCTCIASIGKNAFVPVKCAFNQQINALTPFEYNDPYFILQIVIIGQKQ